MRPHRRGHLDVRLRRATRLGDKRLAVKQPHRVTALPHDIERSFERHRTPQADLRRTVQKAGQNAGAVTAVAALKGPVEAARYRQGLGQKADYLTLASQRVDVMTRLRSV